MFFDFLHRYRWEKLGDIRIFKGPIDRDPSESPYLSEGEGRRVSGMDCRNRSYHIILLVCTLSFCLDRLKPYF